MAILACNQLKAESRTKNLLVASVFVEQDIQDHIVSHDEFVAWFLVAIANQLGDANAGALCPMQSIESLRTTVRDRIAQCQRAFVIVDGLDRCGSTLRSRLRRELAELDKQKLGVMITSRIPVSGFTETGNYEEPDRYFCDVDHNHAFSNPAWNLWLECKSCGKAGMCFSCREKGEVCPEWYVDSFLHGQSELRSRSKSDLFGEPDEEWNDHVNYELGSIPWEEMMNYVKWNLEKEHGDLGLNSKYSRKPPLSNLGVELLNYGPTRLMENLERKGILRNIAIAKARLDNIHGMSSLRTLNASRDKMPTNIIAFFDAEISRIEALPKPKREIGLVAIALLCGDADSLGEISWLDVQFQLRKVLSRLKLEHTLSLESVMEICRGLITIYSKDDEDNQERYYVLVPYNDLLTLYVQENYNESLHWAKVDVQMSGRLPRSFTVQVGLQKPNFRLARTVTDSFSRGSLFPGRRPLISKAPYTTDREFANFRSPSLL